jgi:hypothetical protein
MNPSTAQDLARLQSELEERLAAALAGDPPPWREIEAVSRRLELVRTLATAAQARPSPWVAPAALLLVAISLALAAAAFGPHQVALQVDASVSGFAITAASRAQEVRGLLSVKAGTLASSEDLVPARPGWLARVTIIDGIRLSADAQLEFALAGKGCHRLRVQRGELAAQFTVPDPSDGGPATGRATVREGEEIRFCMKDRGALYPDAVSRVDLATELDASRTPTLFAPSILRAGVQILSTAQVRPLGQTDRLLLDRITDSHVAIVLDDAQAVHFAGTVDDPEVFGFTGPNDRRGRSLRPSWLDIARSSPDLARLSAAVTGLLGLLLGARRWLTSGAG